MPCNPFVKIIFPKICKDMQRYAKICKDMQRYAKVCKDMQRYAKICKDMQSLRKAGVKNLNYLSFPFLFKLKFKLFLVN